MSSKNLLQEYCAQRKIGIPTYETVCVGGSAHCPKFVSTVLHARFGSLEGNTCTTKKDAEQSAAAAMLASVHLMDDELPVAGVTPPLHEVDNPKARLNMYVQAHGLPMPNYGRCERHGRDDDPTFTVTVCIGDKSATGEPQPTKKAAQHSSAQVFLDAHLLVEVVQATVGYNAGDVLSTTNEAFAALSDNIKYLLVADGDNCHQVPQLVADHDRDDLLLVVFGSDNNLRNYTRKHGIVSTDLIHICTHYETRRDATDMLMPVFVMSALACSEAATSIECVLFISGDHMVNAARNAVEQCLPLIKADQVQVEAKQFGELNEWLLHLA